MSESAMLQLPGYLTRAAVLGVLAAGLACQPARPSAPLSSAESAAIADTLKELVESTYDLSKGDVVRRLMSLYPDSGRVVSATAGRTTTTRDSLELAINAFWQGVGQHMVRPRWTWNAMDVDVLDRDAAVMTAQYTVPHYTGEGRPHVIGGVWTSVWTNRDGRWRIVHEHLSDMPRALAERYEAQLPAAAKIDTPASEKR
jgi:ketosteroid isomerase-like protein